MLVRHMSTTALLLGLFAVTGTALVAFTFYNTEEQIAINEREALLRSLHAMVPSSLHDNDMSEDTIMITSKEFLGLNKPATVYRARQKGRPVAAIMTTIAPDGYNGTIKLLVGVRYDGTIMGVRIVSHRETPGLGDAVDIERSDWVKGFNIHSLESTATLGWHVKKDGGVFDQFTGATITPRAVVKAIHKSLQYYAQHTDQLFKITEHKQTEQ